MKDNSNREENFLPITSLVIFGQGLGIGTSLGSKFNNTTMRGKSMMAGHTVLATTTKHDSDLGYHSTSRTGKDTVSDYWYDRTPNVPESVNFRTVRKSFLHSHHHHKRR